MPDRDAATALRPPVASASTFKQTPHFQTTMLVELESEATRFDSSLSWLLQLPITLATPAIAARPSVRPPTPGVNCRAPDQLPGSAAMVVAWVRLSEHECT